MLKKIKNFDEYLVSNEGKIFSDKMNNRRELKSRKNSRGYIYVNLSKNGKYKSKTIHRLVAENFIPNPENKPQVNHKDGNKENNHVDNLEWNTQSENMKHAVDNGLASVLTLYTKGSKNGFAKINEEDALLVKRLLKEGKSKASIAREYNIHYETVKNIAYGKAWSHVIL